MNMEELRVKAKLSGEEIQIILLRHNKSRLRSSLTELALIDAQQEKDFSTPIPKECPNCRGSGDYWGLGSKCFKCDGTGRVSTTLKELVEEYIGKATGSLGPK